MIRQPHSKLILILLAMLGCSILVALRVGTFPLTLGDIFAVVTMRPDVSESAQLVFTTIRFPRVMMGALTGAGLGLAGAALQGIFRNALADPGLLGVSSGASVGAVTWIVFGGVLITVPIWSLPIAGFLGAATCLLLVLKIARVGGRSDTTTLLLAGVAVNAFAGAYIGFASYVAESDALRSFVVWSLGSMSGTTNIEVAIVAGIVCLCGFSIIRYAPELNAMMLGEQEAEHLGIDVAQVRRVVVLTSAAIVAAGVSFTGIIGFIGLVVPHALRLIGGSDHRYLLPGSAIAGGSLMVIADVACRMILAPGELPIGVLTALLGAPFFVYLLTRRHRL